MSKRIKALEQMGDIFNEIMYSHVQKHKEKAKAKAEQKSEEPPVEEENKKKEQEKPSAPVPSWMQKAAKKGE